MHRLSLSGLRARLILLILLALLPLAGLMLYTAAEERRSLIEDAQREAMILSRLAAANQERFVEGGRQLLVSLSESPDLGRTDSGDCARYLAGLRRAFPYYTNILLADLNGDVLCSAVPLAAPVNVSDRNYFRRAVATGDFAIGEYQVGRITGKPGVSFGYPVRDDQGRIRAVVAAALGVSSIDHLMAAAQPPPDAALVMLDSAGTIIARFPDPERWAGQRAPDALAARIAQAGGGAFSGDLTGVDGTHRLYHFTPLGGSPGAGIYLGVGLSRQAAVQAANEWLMRDLIGLGLTGLLALAIAWFGGDLFFLRRVRRLVQATRRLTAGDLGARTGIGHGRGELGELACAFDEMALSLEQREQARTQAEAALMQREVRFRSLVHNVSDIIAVTDAGGALRYVSPSVERVLGYRPDDLTSAAVRLEIDPRDRARVADAFAGLRTLAEPSIVIQFRVRHRDGSCRYLEASAVNLIGQPEVDGIVVNARDVTERKRAEAALRESEARARAIFEEAAIGIALLDTDGRFLDTNPAMQRLLDYGADELRGRSFAEYTAADDLPENSRLFSELIAGARTHYQIEKRWVRRDGRPVWCRVTTSLVRAADGAPQFVVGMIEDIDEQRRLAARLSQAERLSSLGELAAGMAHEINNPLAAISATAELALRADLAPQLREDITQIHHEAGRAGEIVRSLLRFARQREPSLGPVQLRAVVDEVLALHRSRLVRHGVEVRGDFAPVPEILADKDQLLQVFMNLINNAVDAMKPSPRRRLTVALRPVAEGVEVSVTDSGTGIPADVLGRIFDPFVTTKEPGAGTGLGLSISHRIVTDHGGTLVAENNPAGGACFRAIFPPVPAEPTPAARQPEPRVLVIHPDRMAADLLAEAARLVGYDAQLVTDAGEIPAEGVAAALVDPHAPEELFTRLGALSPAVRLIATAPAAGGRRWDATLPGTYRLTDLEQALRGGAA